MGHSKVTLEYIITVAYLWYKSMDPTISQSIITDGDCGTINFRIGLQCSFLEILNTVITSNCRKNFI